MKKTSANALWRFPGTRSIALFTFVYLYLPIIILVILSFTAGDSAVGGWQGFSLKWYGEALQNDNMLSAVKNSLIVAVCAMIAGTTIALMAALATSKSHFRGQRGVEALIGLPLLVPDIVAAIATLMLFVAVGIPLGLTALIISHTVIVIPVAYLPIRARLQGLDESFAHAAADLYAPPRLVFQRIVLPLIWPGILSGAMLAFIGSLGDVVLSFFVSGPGSTTLPVFIFSMIRVGVTPAVNAISVLLLAVSLLLLAVSYVVGRRLQ